MKTSIRRPGSGAACLVLLAALTALSAGAQAQWVWRDASGNVTYSDAPPPADVQPTSILRQPTAPTAADLPNSGNSGPSGTYSTANPGSRGAENTVPPPAGAAEIPRAAGSSKTLAEQEADFRKRSAEREKAAQKAAQDEAQAGERAAACAQAKGYLQMIEGGTRLMRPDAEGNRNFMDEDQRAAEIQKTQEVIAKNC
jgi:hypothetical protein